MENKKNISLLVADDHQLFRSGVISLLNDVNDILIVGEAQSGDEVVEKYFQLKPDLVLLDISMPLKSGVDALKEIKRNDKDVKALFLSMFEGEEYIFYIVKVGGMGLLNKNIMKGELVYAIRSVAKGEKYFGRVVDDAYLKELHKKYRKLAEAEIDEYTALSPREKDILVHIGEGKTSAEIAEIFKLSKRTIDTHRLNLIKKLKLKSFPELIKYAVRFSQAKKILTD